MIDLSGQKAIVTGAARGIGFAIAERLIACGAAVSLWDIDSHAVDAAAMRLTGQGEVHKTVVDVADAKAVKAATEGAIGQLGEIGILVNNAGIVGPIAPVGEYPIEEWQKVLATDLTSAFLCCRFVVPHMLKRGGGHIVNVASLAGKEGYPRAPAYSAAKAGLIGLTKSLGRELATSGIAVNCVAPAAVETEMFKQHPEEHLNYMRANIPMGRLGKVEEVAALVAWLCSAECSFSTGAVFDVSGGRATY